MSQNVIESLKDAIEGSIPGARAEVSQGAGPGHFCLTVVADSFAGKPMVQVHRMVYSAIAHLMQGKTAPVHAIDTLRAIAS